MKGIVGQLAFIGVLALCAISLRKQLDATQSGITTERTRAAISEHLLLTSIAGIDVQGVVRETLPEGAKRFVVAGFRSSAIDHDVRLWSVIAALLADEPAIHIVAYCDDVACADAAMKMPLPGRLTVMRYGEAASSQALLHADGRGDGFVLSPAMETLRRITWRTPGRTAEDIAQEVRQ